jgi:hypothetical protein
MYNFSKYIRLENSEGDSSSSRFIRPFLCNTECEIMPWDIGKVATCPRLDNISICLENNFAETQI